MPAERSLQIDEDMPFQRRIWTAQRIGWAVLAVILLAAFLGVFGSGPLNRATAGDRDVLEVGYGRFARFQAATELRVQVAPGGSEGGQAEVRPSAGYLRSVDVQLVTPEPIETRAGAGGLIYVFAVEEGESLEATFNIVPERLGRLQGEVQLLDGEPVRFSQFVVDGAPLVLVEEGRPLDDRMQRARVGEKDVLVAAREAHGLERMADQVRRAGTQRAHLDHSGETAGLLAAAV